MPNVKYLCRLWSCPGFTGRSGGCVLSGDELTGLQAGGSVHPEVPLRGSQRDLLSKLGRHTAAQLGQGPCRENRAAQSQGCAGAETGGHAPCHVAHEHIFPGDSDGIGPETETALIVSTTECVQPGRPARVRSPPGLRQRPRTPLRSTRP